MCIYYHNGNEMARVTQRNLGSLKGGNETLCSSCFCVIPPQLLKPDCMALINFTGQWHSSAWTRGGATHYIGQRSLGMGTENRYFFGPVRNWVNTLVAISFRINYTVFDTCVVLSCCIVNGELEAAASCLSFAVCVLYAISHRARVKCSKV